VRFCSRVVVEHIYYITTRSTPGQPLGPLSEAIPFVTTQKEDKKSINMRVFILLTFIVP